MSDDMHHYCCPPRFRREPLFVRQLRREATELGSVSEAMHHMFERGRIVVDVIGDTSVWGKPDIGTLLVGDHRDRFEFAPLLAALGRLGRSDVHFIAKPYSRNSRIIHAAGRYAEDMILPVFPGTLARDRVRIINRDILRRIGLGDRTPTQGNLRALNARTVHRAAACLETGRLVTVYPCGAVTDALRSPWHRGLGNIIKRVSPERRPALRVVLFRFDDFAAIRIVRRLNLQSRGVLPRRPYRICLRIGAQGSIEHLLGQHAPIDHLDANEITQRLRRRFVESFVS